MSFFKSKQTGEQIRSVGAISTVGLSFVVAIVMGAWFGRLVDGWLGTAPIFFIVFFFIGLAAGILNVFRTVSRAFPPRTAPPSAQVNSRQPEPDGQGPGDD